MEEIAPKKKRKVANLDYSKLGRKGKEKSPWNNGPNVKSAKNTERCEGFKNGKTITKNTP